MKVLSTFRIREVSVPTCSYCTKNLIVLRVYSGIKDESCLVVYHYILEEREVTIGFHGFFKYVVVRYIVLICLNKLLYKRVGCLRLLTVKSLALSLQVYLFQSQLFYLFVLVRTIHAVIGCHLRIFRIYFNRFCRVYCNVDNLSCNT